MNRFLIILVLALALLPLATSQTPVPATFFGTHVHSQSNINNVNWPTTSFGTLRLWDTKTTWADINTAQGVYNWTLLDGYINWASSHGIPVLYEVGHTPTWASHSPTDSICSGNLGSCDRPNQWAYLDTFIAALVSRYRGRIQAYEVWNEPHNNFYWNPANNSAADFVTLTQHIYNGIRTADPAALILSPSGNFDWMDSTYYSTSGAIKTWDIISQHGYPSSSQQPESMIAHTQSMQTVMRKYGLTKPIWTSESSWGLNNSIDPLFASGYVARWALLQWSIGIQRAYWYAWDNQAWGTLFNTTTKTVLPAGVAYGQVYNWMVGATMSTPCSNQGTIWTCGFTRTSPVGYQAKAIWDTSQTCSVGSCTTLPQRVPSIYTQYRDLTGNVVQIQNNIVPVGTRPVLLENSGRTYFNIDDTLSGWAVCVKPLCDPGGPDAPLSYIFSINNVVPSTDGHSMKLSETTKPGSSQTNILTTFKTGSSTLTASSILTLSFDAKFYLSANSASASSFEYDQFIFIAPCSGKCVNPPYNVEFMFGTQCHQGGTAKWQIFNQQTNSWVDTSLHCSLSPSTWHHIQQTVHRVAGDSNNCNGQPCMYYDSLTIDGIVQPGFAAVLPAGTLPSTWGSDTGFQFQIDVTPANTTVSENMDEASFTQYGGSNTEIHCSSCDLSLLRNLTGDLTNDFTTK